MMIKMEIWLFLPNARWLQALNRCVSFFLSSATESNLLCTAGICLTANTNLCYFTLYS